MCDLMVECRVMSAVIGVNFGGDVIFCSEGKETWHRAALPVVGLDKPRLRSGRNDVIKTIALNESVCIAVVGYSDALFVLLKKLLPDFLWANYDIWTPPFNFLETQDQPLSAMTLVDARERVCEIVNEALKMHDLGSKYLVDSKIMLGGQDNTPYLYMGVLSANEFTLDPVQFAYAPPPAVYFKPSDRFRTPDSVADIVLRNCLDLPSCLRACARAIEEYAAHSETCNDNVMFRRLSHGFTLEDKDTVLGACQD